MDRMRRDTPLSWPSWCLLPMGAAAAVTGTFRPDSIPQPIAFVSALYAWRYSRAVYLVHPALLDRLLATVLDDLTDVDRFAELPHWCVYIAAETGGAGLWAHLEHDANTGRPELRLLLDNGGELYDPHLAVPVYLDRSTLTEALADWRTTIEATLAGSGEVVPGQNIRGGALDAAVATFADNIDGYISLLAYLARPEADIVCLDRPGQRPVRPRSPVRDRTTWAVGYNT